MIPNDEARPVAIPEPVEVERRFLLRGVPWETYVALRDATDAESSHVRMTYSRGDLELMSPSRLHEDAKTIIARLLEAWAVERRVDLRGFGNMTLRAEAKKSGLEPDECYKLGEPDDDSVPDIAIEVIVTNPLLDKLAVYARLGVPEVWTWQPEVSKSSVLRWEGDAYRARASSEILPELDLQELSRFVKPGRSQTQLTIEYLESLRSR